MIWLIVLSLLMTLSGWSQEIKIGTTAPLTGPLAAYATIVKTQSAYFDKINQTGGVNGRKISYLIRDDASNPTRTLDETKKLVEEDKVFLMCSQVGTATTVASQSYLNEKKIPQLFVISGASLWNNPEKFPWSMAFLPSYASEAKIYARYILKSFPDARIGILYQNDEYGRDYLTGFKEGLGARASQLIVKEEPYDVTATSVDQQIISLRDSGATIFFNVSLGTFAIQSIRKAFEIGWRPIQFLNSTAASIDVTFKQAGVDRSRGIITTTFLKDPRHPRWVADSSVKEYLEFMKQFNPTADAGDLLNVWGYSAAQALVDLLIRCGSSLTRENVMKEATHLELKLPMMLPGITMRTSPKDYALFDRMQLLIFEGSMLYMADESLSI